MLVEREAQLAALASYAQEARKAQGRLVLVAGEAGVGKSVGRAARRRRGRGSAGHHPTGIP